MEKKKEKEIIKEYKKLVKGKDTIHNSPYINTKWEKRNGMYVKFSLYTDNGSLSSSSNGNSNLLKS